MKVPGGSEELNFPSFSEGLSLRQERNRMLFKNTLGFPFLFGRAFIEAWDSRMGDGSGTSFPFLFGRAFIEASGALFQGTLDPIISLPFRKGFH